MTASGQPNSSNLQQRLKEIEKYTEDTLAKLARHYDNTNEFPQALMMYFFQHRDFLLLFSDKSEELDGFFELIRIVSKKFASLASILLTQAFYAVMPLYRFGTEDQKKTYLEKLIDGRYYGAFALSEDNEAGDPSYLHTLAVETPTGWIINGNKKYISNASVADILLVVARTKYLDADEGIGVFIVETNVSGLRISEPMEKMGIKSLPVCSATFQHVTVNKNAKLGSQEDGLEQVSYTMNMMKLAVAMQAVGISQGAFEKGLEHMSIVRKFGNRLIDNQSIQEKMADIKTSIYSAEAFVKRVIYDNPQNEVEVAMAKLLTANVAVETTEVMIQLTGGYGYMKESEIERYIRDAKVTAIYGGSSHSQRRIISKPWLEDNR